MLNSKVSLSQTESEYSDMESLANYSSNTSVMSLTPSQQRFGSFSPTEGYDSSIGNMYSK